MQIKRSVLVTVLKKKTAPLRMLQTLPVVMIARVKPGIVFKEVRPWA